VERIIVAGELEYDMQIVRERDGIPLDAPVLEALATLEHEFGLL
jgi:LDH2 family malate/lactate/ureidoglycolate dehydrogenase